MASPSPEFHKWRPHPWHGLEPEIAARLVDFVLVVEAALAGYRALILAH